MDFNKKLTAFACGVVATTFSFGGLLNETLNTESRETFIGPDGHAGVKATKKENIWAAAATAGVVTTFAATASMFGAKLREDKENDSAAIIAARQKQITR